MLAAKVGHLVVASMCSVNDTEKNMSSNIRVTFLGVESATHPHGESISLSDNTSTPGLDAHEFTTTVNG